MWQPNGRTQQIEAITLTSNTVDDATEVKSLLSRINKPLKVLGEMGLMARKEMEQLQKGNIRQTISPHRNAVTDKKKRPHMAQRDKPI
jgi:hypothetical protein